jgi:hypothetical protein
VGKFLHMLSTILLKKAADLFWNDGFQVQGIKKL